MATQNYGRRSARRSGPNAFAAFFIVFFVLAAVLAAFFALDFFRTDQAPADVTYTFGNRTYTLSAADAYSDGVLMISFDDIAAVCEMTVTGSVTEKTYYAENSEERIALCAGSDIAVVNGNNMDMLADAKRVGDELYVPLAFVEQFMAGISVKHTANGVTVARGEYNASTKENPLYSDPAFSVKEEETIPVVTEPPRVAPTYSFISDLSAYEQYMCPEDIDGYLILVNKEKTLDANYVPDNLVDIKDSRSDRTERMVETAERALEALYIEMRAAGYTDVSVTSGYRTYEKQEYLYNLYTEQEMKAAGISRAEAQKIVDTYSARPGTSEHQTGLCCDMHNLGSASQAFAKKEVYTWLVENCYKFGFILRFPEDKEEITGYSFEPWHYRFVGRYHASEMHRLGMCLEEYIEYLEAQESAS